VIYRTLLERTGDDTVVRCGIIGTGEYATAILAQSRYVRRLEVPVVADIHIEAAREAYAQSGYSADDIVVAGNRSAALEAIERGQAVILQDPLLMMDLPVGVIVESTGAPEAGASHALAAIEHGKHVAIVNKEVDVTVGPILKRLADRASVVYSAVDGDQHGLLTSLVDWARELGFEVLCGGKFRGAEIIVDPAARTVVCGEYVVSLDADGVKAFRPLASGMTGNGVGTRKALTLAFSSATSADLDEMTIVANATGLVPDLEQFHAPVLSLPEIPKVLCPAREGGILEKRGIVEVVVGLRQRHEAPFGGGVFIVVTVANAYAQAIMASKGTLANSRRSAFLIYRPYHLCGVETPLSILAAGLLKLPTGARDYKPRFDVVYRAKGTLRAGETLREADTRLETLVRPSNAVTNGAPLPRHMADGNALRADIPAGSLIKAEMVVAPRHSVLWSLRAQQDREFASDT
jgi:predicted homoserine dehydrogenase-like protein